MPRHDRILWWGNARELAVADRLAFAATLHFGALSIWPADIEALIASGETLPSIRRLADMAGVALTYLDPVVGWLPDWRPEGDAAALGIDRVLAVTCFPTGRFSVGDVAPHLALPAALSWIWVDVGGPPGRRGLRGCRLPKAVDPRRGYRLARASAGPNHRPAALRFGMPNPAFRVAREDGPRAGPSAADLGPHQGVFRRGAGPTSC
ncbi:MAG: hypothetical protein AAGE03_00385 [Pseudomonadota bacterium]